MPIIPIEELELLHARVCKAVTEPRRLQILYALEDGPRNVGNLAETLGMPQPTVSRHLGILRQRGIVIAERDGNTVNYSLGDDRIIQVMNIMRQILQDVLKRERDLLD